jgi:hypothetical protein
MKDVGEPLTLHPDDPALSAKVKLEVDGSDLADVFAALAKASGLAVVSDSFERWGNFPAEEMSLRAVLDKLESDRRYNWEKHGSTLELHDRDWCKKRAALIPDAWLEAWRKALKKNGLLDLNELSQIALLTKEQVSANLAQDEVLGQAGVFGFGAGMDNRDLLTAYAALDKHQRALILTKQGLALDSLADNQSPAVQALLRHCSSLQGGSHGGLWLAGKREIKDGRIYYDFNVSKPSHDTMGLRWFVNCPAYKPPVRAPLGVHSRVFRKNTVVVSRRGGVDDHTSGRTTTTTWSSVCLDWPLARTFPITCSIVDLESPCGAVATAS